MLPSTNPNDAPDPSQVVLARGDSPPDGREPAVLYRVVRLPSGNWSLETPSGDVGGVFATKHAALTYACAEAEGCPSASVVIELVERRPGGGSPSAHRASSSRTLAPFA